MTDPSEPAPTPFHPPGPIPPSLRVTSFPISASRIASAEGIQAGPAGIIRAGIGMLGEADGPEQPQVAAFGPIASPELHEQPPGIAAPLAMDPIVPHEHPPGDPLFAPKPE